MVDIYSIKWDVDRKVRAFTSLRGVDRIDLTNPYSGLNLASHVGDDSMLVEENRKILTNQMQWQSEPKWLDQTHSTNIVLADDVLENTSADGSYTRQSGVVCVVMTADCLPVFIADPEGTCVGVFHAGWRGLVDGILEKAVEQLKLSSNQLVAAIGPAIGPQAFEVGSDVREQFLDDCSADKAYFKPSPRSGFYYADLYQLAERRLLSRGVMNVQLPNSVCTFSDPERFYSYRRQGQCGRMASFIWLEN